MANHTYQHRVETILSTLGISDKTIPTYIEVVPVDDSIKLDSGWLRKFVDRQLLPESVYFTNGASADSAGLDDVEKLRLYVNPKVEYGQYFTFDLLMTLRQQNAALVCKSFRYGDAWFE